MTRNDTPTLPSVEALKAQARRLRDTLTAQGTTLGNAQSLEMLSHQLGYRDWNTLRAAADRPQMNRPNAPVLPGDRVTGHYLGQAFAGEVLALRKIDGGRHFQVTLKFDEAVDVVRFDSFSSMRQRVNATIDAHGVSPQHTSDGAPQLRLTL